MNNSTYISLTAADALLSMLIESTAPTALTAEQARAIAVTSEQYGTALTAEQAVDHLLASAGTVTLDAASSRTISIWQANTRMDPLPT